ncbi:MAG: NADH-quinone oxidoreductase subunit J [Egibacteraceae bacterium]
MTGALTTVLAQVQPDLPATSGSAEFWVFWVLAPIALGSGVSVVMLRNPVHAALMLVANFFTIAVLFAVLEAQFLAVVQIIVYAGAIMVLFLFVIMLLGVDRPQEWGRDRIPGQRPAAILMGILLFAVLLVGVAGPYLSGASACNIPPQAATGTPCQGLAGVNAAPGGNVRGIGLALFTTYVWPFEVASVLLVIAALGAIILGRKREDPTDLSEGPAQKTRPAAPRQLPAPEARR